MVDRGFKAAFESLIGALAKGDLEGFYGLILPNAAILDEDLPFRVDRAGFQAHIAFHGPASWEGFSYKPYDVRFASRGTSGVACGFAMFRGKPRDAGFRLRPMMFQQGWTRTSGGWRLASWHQSPVVGHVNRPSPG